MSLETIALIGILTFIPITLGTDFAWLFIIQPGLNQINVSSTNSFPLEPFNFQDNKLYLLIYALILIAAILLNLVSQSRLEPYLLKIGLIGLGIYFLLMIGSIFSLNSAIATVNDSKPMLQNYQSLWKLSLWLRLMSLLVAHWSFLHYAMNPKKDLV